LTKLVESVTLDIKERLIYFTHQKEK